MVTRNTGKTPDGRFKDESRNRVFAKGTPELGAMVRDFESRVASGELRSLSFGVPEIDEVVKTVWPGRLLTILARPSMFKTSLMVGMARIECQRLMALEDNKRYVMFVSLEEDEEDVYLNLTRSPVSVTDMLSGPYDREALLDHVNKHAVAWPIHTVGIEARPTAGVALEDQPRLTVDQVYREISQLEKDGHGRPSAIFADYLQLLDMDGAEDERHLAVGYALRMFKKIGQIADCPVVLAVQAKERVDDSAPPIPQVGDAYYSSEVAHASDVMVSLWMPFRTPAEKRAPKGKQFEMDGVTEPTADMLWVQLLKQRKLHGRAGWLCRANFEDSSIRGNVHFGDIDHGSRFPL